MKTTQLCYASKRVESEYTLIEDLRDILVKSRDYNSENNICGVLYYAHGYYFQCIQGEFTSLIKLYNKILLDERHSDIKLIQHKSIREPCFYKWSMKYVQQNTELDNFFLEIGNNKFKPLNVTEKKIDEFINIILSYSEVEKENFNSGFINRGYSGYF